MLKLPRKRISIGPKIISREGVSARTTGNLQLTGEYEEFGAVQEQRKVEGGNITIHGDVYGIIESRGGDISLNRNLMGGAATNADGAIRVRGVASGAVLQTKKGEVALTPQIPEVQDYKVVAAPLKMTTELPGRTTPSRLPTCVRR